MVIIVIGVIIVQCVYLCTIDPYINIIQNTIWENNDKTMQASELQSMKIKLEYKCHSTASLLFVLRITSN